MCKENPMWLALSRWMEDLHDNSDVTIFKVTHAYDDGDMSFVGEYHSYLALRFFPLIEFTIAM